MFRVIGNASSRLLLAGVLSLVCSGCGGSSTGSNSNNLSQPQAQAVTAEVSLALAQALGSTFTGLPVAGDEHPALAAAVSEIHPDTLTLPCTPTSTGENCNWPISYSGPCSGGGTISVAGDISGILDNSGGGSILSQLTVTPAGCSVSGLVLNGAPSVSVNGQINFTQTAPVFPITLSETGGISYGPNPSGSCRFNVTYTVTSTTSCTITGTACGQSVSGPC